MDQVLASVPRWADENVLIGFDTADDAGVYKLTAELALVQTVDFFTPIVDDPYTFGAIAAANALSDVYAMGGRPISALSIVAYPGKGDLEDLAADPQGRRGEDARSRLLDSGRAQRGRRRNQVRLRGDRHCPPGARQGQCRRAAGRRAWSSRSGSAPGVISTALKRGIAAAGARGGVHRVDADAEPPRLRRNAALRGRTAARTSPASA